MNLLSMFKDQRLFNQQIYSRTSEDPGLVERLRHLALGMYEETSEFLGTFEHKAHRRKTGKLPNVAHSHEELVDMFKYWLSLADLVDFPMERLEELYYAKSRVVQYRYQEEWMQEIDGPCVIVDIDNVLADYISGFCDYAMKHLDLVSSAPSDRIRIALRLQEMKRMVVRVNYQTADVAPDLWRKLKHQFRVDGGKRQLPVLEGAREFLQWCRRSGWLILLVTSRPIDRYPNIFTDTVTWLHDNNLPFDHLWWADKKEERIQEAQMSIRSKIVFAVDDDLTYVHQFNNRGIKTYWMARTKGDQEFIKAEVASGVTVVQSLAELMEKEKMAHGV